MRLGHVKATGGFFILFAWLIYIDHQNIVPLVMVACAAHEFGHYITIRMLGGNIKYVRLTAIGAEMALSRPLGYWREGVAALAGPGVNLFLAVILCHFPWSIELAGLNLVLGCFNLMPLGRLDGGRALHCTLALLLGPDWATAIGAWMDLAATVLLLVTGLLLVGLGGNLTLLLVSFWLVAVFISGKKRGNRACYMGRKRVK